MLLEPHIHSRKKKRTTFVEITKTHTQTPSIYRICTSYSKVVRVSHNDFQVETIFHMFFCWCRAVYVHREKHETHKKTFIHLCIQNTKHSESQPKVLGNLSQSFFFLFFIIYIFNQFKMSTKYFLWKTERFFCVWTESLFFILSVNEI